MSRRIPNFDRDNRAAARLILANIERYGGETGLMVRHSRAVLQRLGKGKPERPAVDERGQMSIDWVRAA
jgi:hypothetical protein